MDKAVGDSVDPNEAGCAFYESPLGSVESDGSQSLKKGHVTTVQTGGRSYANNVTFLHAGIRDGVIRRRQNV